MKKKLVFTLAGAMAITAAMSGCSMTGEPTATIAPVEKPAQVVNVLDEYAILAGHTMYTAVDGAYSIQLPEGSTIDDSDPNNVNVTITGEFETPDLINIAKKDDVTVIEAESALMDMLKNDNSIDITGFFVLKNAGAYEGYKYTYTAVADAQLKGIKSTYFSADGTAYVVTATINNGGDEVNMTNVNTVVDTFINYN